MPGSSNNEYHGSACNNSYQTLGTYTGVKYLPFLAKQRIITPSFNAVSGYTTGYAANQANNKCDCNIDNNYVSLGNIGSGQCGSNMYVNSNVGINTNGCGCN